MKQNPNLSVINVSQRSVSKSFRRNKKRAMFGSIGGNPSAHRNESILQPEPKLLEPKLLEPKIIRRPNFELWICYVCKKFEADSEEGLLNHLHRGHNS